MRSIRRPFLLLEVLIALALVALVLFPLIQVPLLLTKRELLFQERVRSEHYMQNSFAKIAYLLYSKQVSFEDLFVQKERLLENTSGYKAHYIINTPKVKTENDTPRYLLFPVTIKIQLPSGSTLTDTFQLFVEKERHAN